MTADVWAYFFIFMKDTRVKKVAELVVASGGKKSLRKAIKEAGYSDAYAKNSHKITKTKTWAEIMDRYFPDEKIAKTHNKLLNAKGFTSKQFPLDMEDEDIKDIVKRVGGSTLKIFEGKNEYGQECKKCFFSYPKEVVIDKALDKVYKLKGRYTEKIEFSGDFRNLPNEDLMFKIKELSKSLFKK